MITVNSRYLPTLETTGRSLLASLFLIGGIYKILNPTIYIGMLKTAGIGSEFFILIMVTILELVGGTMILLNSRHSDKAAIALALFTLATNLVVHRFWETDSPIKNLEISAFFKNISISGGLLVYAVLHKSRAAICEKQLYDES